MSSTGSIAEHPVVTGLRTAAGALDPAALELGWQLGDDDVETAIATVLDLARRARPRSRRCCCGRPRPAT